MCIRDSPGIVLDDGGWIIGEVFTDVSAPQLEALDIYEGCEAAMPVAEHLYRRLLAPAILPDAQQLEVWVWEYARPVSTAQRIASGDWLTAP